MPNCCRVSPIRACCSAGAIHHAVVFYRPESLFIGKFDLVGKFGAGVGLEQTVMDAIIEVEGGAGFGCCGGAECSSGEERAAGQLIVFDKNSFLSMR